MLLLPLSASAPAASAPDPPMEDAPPTQGPLTYSDAVRAGASAPDEVGMLRAYIARLETGHNNDRRELAQAHARIEQMSETPPALAAPPAAPAPVAIPIPASAAAAPAGFTNRPADASHPDASASTPLPALCPRYLFSRLC